LVLGLSLVEPMFWMIIILFSTSLEAADKKRSRLDPSQYLQKVEMQKAETAATIQIQSPNFSRKKLINCTPANKPAAESQVVGQKSGDPKNTDIPNAKET